MTNWRFQFIVGITLAGVAFVATVLFVIFQGGT